MYSLPSHGDYLSSVSVRGVRGKRRAKAYTQEDNSSEKDIKQMKVLIYSKRGCHYCRQAKQLSRHMQYKTKVIDLSDPDQFDTLRWFELEGYSTVPQVFVDGEHVGGFAEFEQLVKQKEFR